MKDVFLRWVLLAMYSTCNAVARALFVIKNGALRGAKSNLFLFEIPSIISTTTRVFINVVLLSVDEVVLRLDTP